MAVYYLTLDDLAFPLLFLGILLAVFQFTFSDTSKQLKRSDKLVRRLAGWLAWRTNSIWAVLVCALGLYILFKLIPTSIGWTIHKFGVSVWLGVALSTIDDRVGVISILILSLIIYLTVRGILDWRTKKTLGKINDKKN